MANRYGLWKVAPSPNGEFMIQVLVDREHAKGSGHFMSTSRPMSEADTRKTLLDDFGVSPPEVESIIQGARNIWQQEQQPADAPVGGHRSGTAPLERS